MAAVRGTDRATATATRILDKAEELVQVRGFNGFSYADVAAPLELTKAGLHYHYPAKAELGLAVVTRYSERFRESLERIDAAGLTPPERLESYVAVYADVVATGRMCLCGMLAAEYPTLPAPMQAAVQAFVDVNQRWLTGLLDAGVQDGSLSITGPTADVATMLVAGLEGAMLMARPYGDVGRFDVAAAQLVAALVAPRSTGRRPGA